MAMPDDIVARAAAENQWFTPGDIRRAAEAIASQMLDQIALREWTARYDIARDEPRRVGVVMAGNIPLVGFFDMLCVLAAGDECLYKPSSKDAVLVDFVASELGKTLPVHRWEGQPIDALIATGSDNARRHFRDLYAGLPMLLRGSRGSVAVLDGGEADNRLRAMSNDIFDYSGLGCRNVSRIFLPTGYDLIRLATILAEHRAPSEGYYNNYIQRRAMLQMQGVPFIDGGFFVLREGDNFPEYISEITYSFGDGKAWLSMHKDAVQCVVGCDTDFGRAHLPGLGDYADGVDTMQFLSSI